MAVDMYLELEGGSPAVVGETLDSEMSKKKAMQIESFAFSAQADDNAPEEDDGMKQCIDPDMPFYAPPEEIGITQKALAWSIPFTVKKQVDRASPALFFSYCKSLSGVRAEFPKARVYFRKGGGVDPSLCYLTLEFSKARLVGYKVELSTGERQGVSESLTFRFAACKYIYKPQKVSGEAARPNEKGFDLDLKRPL